MDRQEVEDILIRLRKQGFAVVDPIPPEQFEETRDYLHWAPVYLNAHVPQTAKSRGEDYAPREAASQSECFCTPMWAAITAPHIFEKALELTDVAAAYLGRDPPVCYSANAFWTRPGNGALREDIQAFHSDADDVRFLAMFVYLTDVLRAEDGPHQITGANGVISTIYGPAGTVFLADTARPHRGQKPTSGERGIAWFRWGVSDRPPANIWDNNRPIRPGRLLGRYPDDPRLRESIKLIVE